MDQRPHGLILVRSREQGFAVVQPPADGRTLAQVVADELGLQGGYTVTELPYDGDPQATAVWVAWVEGRQASRPYVDFRFYDANLTEAEVQEILTERTEEVVDLQRCEIRRTQA